MKENKELNVPSFEKIQSSRYYDSRYYDVYLVVAPEGSTREEVCEFVRKEIDAFAVVNQVWPYEHRGPDVWYVEICTD
jgi:hypothetical protein